MLSSLVSVVERCTFIDFTSKFVVFGQPHVSTLSGQGKTPIQTVTAWRLLLAASCSHVRIQVPLTRFPPVFQERIGVSKFHNPDNCDVLGAAYRPGAQCPFVSAFPKLLKPGSVPVGAGVSVSFASSELRSCSSSVYLLHNAVSWQIESERLLSFHVVFRASHHTVTSIARRNRNTLNGWGGFH